MSTFTVFQATALTAGEQSAVAAIGMTGEDAQDVLVSCQRDLDMVKVKLARISANMGAGANKTAIDAMVTALT